MLTFMLIRLGGNIYSVDLHSTRLPLRPKKKKKIFFRILTVSCHRSIETSVGRNKEIAQTAAESMMAGFVPSVPLSAQVKAGCHELMEGMQKKKKKIQEPRCACVCASVRAQVVMAAVFITPFTDRSPGANQIGFRRADREAVGECGGGHIGTASG